VITTGLSWQPQKLSGQLGFAQGASQQILNRFPKEWISWEKIIIDSANQRQKDTESMTFLTEAGCLTVVYDRLLASYFWCSHLNFSDDMTGERGFNMFQPIWILILWSIGIII
jgi:hypothetical protein